MMVEGDEDDDDGDVDDVGRKVAIIMLMAIALMTTTSMATESNDCYICEYHSATRFPSKPIIIRVPFFLIFSFNKETLN